MGKVFFVKSSAVWVQKGDRSEYILLFQPHTRNSYILTIMTVRLADWLRFSADFLPEG